MKTKLLSLLLLTLLFMSSCSSNSGDTYDGIVRGKEIEIVNPVRYVDHNIPYVDTMYYAYVYFYGEKADGGKIGVVYIEKSEVRTKELFNSISEGDSVIVLRWDDNTHSDLDFTVTKKINVKVDTLK